MVAVDQFVCVSVYLSDKMVVVSVGVVQQEFAQTEHTVDQLVDQIGGFLLHVVYQFLGLLARALSFLPVLLFVFGDWLR